MEGAIQSSQMDLEREEVRPEQALPRPPHERHIWRMPELPPIPQDKKKELEVTPEFEEGPVASTSFKPAPETSNEKLKGPQRKRKGPKNHQGKGKGKGNWHRPYQEGYRIHKLEPRAMESVFNMSRTLV
ncbi:hypothetical protein O181_129348, partial [Austropuccinia psidii MF-1]|nr:hypothetical protein [Austropuccinia psidii MF-1]